MAKIECKNLMFKQLTSFDYIYLVFSRLDFHLVNLKKKKKKVKMYPQKT